MTTTRFATADDGPALTVLAVAAGEPIISIPDSWDHRLGDGTGATTGLTIVAEHDAQVAAFLWADNAMRIDAGMPLPWLCINAVYTSPTARGQGLGADLVTSAIERAADLDMTVVHGSCLPSAATWWASDRFGAWRFTVGPVDGEWNTHVSVDGKALNIGSEGNCPFWLHLGDPTPVILTAK